MCSPPNPTIILIHKPNAGWSLDMMMNLPRYISGAAGREGWLNINYMYVQYSYVIRIWLEKMDCRGTFLKLLMNYTLSVLFPPSLMFTLLCPKNAIFAAATYIYVHIWTRREGGKGASFCVNITTEQKKNLIGTHINIQKYTVRGAENVQKPKPTSWHDKRAARSQPRRACVLRAGN